MIKSLTNSQQSSVLRGLTAGVFALMLAVFAMPAQAQMDDGELPKIDFSVNLMQGAQYIQADAPGDADDPDPNSGFHLVRAGLVSSVQFSDNVSGLLMLEQEPNDFGGQFAPAVDFAILDIQATDQLTIRTGTPVTGLMNFRGFSDGPAVQGNPLIGNSPADMITAGEGVKLIGSYDTFGFDLTINKGFGGTLTGQNGQNTGVNIIAKARYTGSDMFQVGAGVATATGKSSLVFAGGDGENYHITGDGSVAAVRNTHANIPGGTIFQADAKVMAGGADVDLWAGYGSDSPEGVDATSAALFGGLGLKYDVSDNFYLAGRFTYVTDQSDDEAGVPENPGTTVGELDGTTLNRIQVGVGYHITDNALLKIEGVSQSEGDGGVTNPRTGIETDDNGNFTGVDDPTGEGFTGVSTELSFNF